jgi:ABC-type multidrug transport system fused ATPase/permease subunit
MKAREAMPLSEHEQKILEDIERRLQQEDPRFAQQVAHHSLMGLLSRRIRIGALLFVAGFVLLMLFMVSLWVALAGFAVMLFSALFIYNQLRRLGRDARNASGAGRLSMSDILGRLGQRFRGDRGDRGADQE